MLKRGEYAVIWVKFVKCCAYFPEFNLSQSSFQGVPAHPTGLSLPDLNPIWYEGLRPAAHVPTPNQGLRNTTPRMVARPDFSGSICRTTKRGQPEIGDGRFQAGVIGTRSLNPPKPYGKLPGAC